MSLQTNQSISVTGHSMVGDTPVVFLSANISTETDGSSSVNQNIQNKELYKNNIIECRKDIDEFQKLVRQVEDDFFTKNFSGEK